MPTSVIDALLERWSPLKNRFITRSAEPQGTDLETLRHLLEQCIEAGRDVVEPDLRAKLQWMAREIGAVLRKATGEYPSTLIEPAREVAFSAGKIGSSAPFWMVPPHNPDLFTGRRDLLEQLHKELRQGGRAALCGLPGMGKTLLALEYAHRRRDEYGAIVFINVATEDTLIADCREIVRRVGLRVPDPVDTRVLVVEVLRWLEARESWLLILDNADDLDLARRVLPATTKGSLLLTTRVPNPVEIARPLPVEVMSNEEGALLLLRRAGLVAPGQGLDSARDGDPQAALSINEAVGGLPLALDQAGAYLASHQITPARYLDLYQQRGRELRMRRVAGGFYDRDPVAVTFWLAFRQVEEKSRAAADLLRLCALLAPEAIPEEIFVTGAGELGDSLSRVAVDELELNEAIHEAGRHSLVQRDPENRTLTVHRITQDVLKDQMSDEEHRQWAERAVRVLFRASTAVGPRDWSGAARLLPHMRKATDLVKAEGMDFPEAGRLLCDMAFNLLQRDAYVEANDLAERAVGIAQAREDDAGEAAARYYLGTIALRRNAYQDAEGPFARALAIAQEIGHRRLEAATLHQLGTIDLYRDRHGTAQTKLESALAIFHEIGDPANEASAWHQLATIHLQRDDYPAARSGFEKALELKRAVDDRAGEAETLHQLATIDLSVGDYPSAEEKFKNSLAIKETIEDRTGQADTWYQLAAIDMARALYEEAGRKLETALVMHRQIGNRSGEAAALHGLAAIDQRMERYAAARAKMEQCLAVTRQIGNRHGEAAALIQLGTIEAHERNHEVARSKFTEALQMFRSLKDRAGEATALHNLGALDLDVDNVESAQKQFDAALRIRQTIGDRAGEAATLHGLASADLKRDNYTAAREKFVASLTIAQAIRDQRGEAATFYQLGMLAVKEGRILEGARLVALYCLIDHATGHSDIEKTFQVLSGLVARLNYGPEQLEALLREVITSYREDRGQKLVEAASGGD